MGFFSALLIDRVCNNFTKDYLFWHIYFFINIYLMYVAPFFKVASWSLIKSRILVMLKGMLLDLEYSKVRYLWVIENKFCSDTRNHKLWFSSDILPIWNRFQKPLGMGNQIFVFDFVWKEKITCLTCKKISKYWKSVLTRDRNQWLFVYLCFSK